MFVFASTAHSKPGKSVDTILDFVHGSDKIDLSAIAGLGSVENQDSPIGMFVIQAPKGVWHAPIRFDRRPVG